jgi:hypothetical protein
MEKTSSLPISRFTEGAKKIGRRRAHNTIRPQGEN